MRDKPSVVQEQLLRGVRDAEAQQAPALRGSQLPDATKRLAPQELTILVYETIDVFLCTSASNSNALISIN